MQISTPAERIEKPASVSIKMSFVCVHSNANSNGSAVIVEQSVFVLSYFFRAKIFSFFSFFTGQNLRDGLNANLTI